MNFEPPDFRKDNNLKLNNITVNNTDRNFRPRLQYPMKPNTSPLLGPNSPNKYFDNTNQPRNQTFKQPVYSRLGNRNFAPGNTNNIPDAPQQNNNGLRQGNFNRKRVSESSVGPNDRKRQWINKKPFYKNHQQSNPHNQNSVQNRLSRPRSSEQVNNTEFTGNYEISQSGATNLSDLQDFDANDITVEIVNSEAISGTPVQQENIARFKMLLDPHTQTAIRMIQQKRKDKQVIFPVPVTPNITGISLHERFTML